MPIIKPQAQSFRWLFAELLIVVLGILIAFQVDEWRSSRSAQNSVRNSLAAILVELEDEGNNIQAYIHINRVQSTASQALLNHILNSNSLDANFIKEKYAEVRRTRLWEPHSSSYSSMRDSGNFSLIQDESLQVGLFDYYEWIDYINIQLDRHNDRASRLINAALEDIYLVSDSDSTNEIGVTVGVVEPISEMPRNPSLVGSLGEFEMSTTNLTERLEETLERNINIQLQIEVYLE